RPLFGAYRRHSANSALIQNWLQLVASEGLSRQQKTN
ncbi:LysR family transcriptional regulator, partial [Shewanella baltica]|nr:LysR family transcriptional regulator [Shewanella baltica]